MAILGVLLPKAAFGAFLNDGGSPIITLDASFSDWGTLGSPTSGIANISDNASPSISQGKWDINNFWMGFSTADGTAPVTGNEVQDFYFRVDTADADGAIDSAFNIQLNLDGTESTAGKATHLLQALANDIVDADADEVTLRLYTYDDPIPTVGAFTTGAITARVANVSGFGDVDTNAKGRIGAVTGGYGFEFNIPVAWFAPPTGGANDWGGKFNANGSGASSVVTSIFSSSTTSGLGAPKDVVNDADGKTIGTITLTATGGTKTVVLKVDRLNFSNSAQTATAGVATSVMTVETRDAIGPRNVESDTTIDLTSTSSAGTFSTTSDFSSTVTSVTITSGTSSTEFY